MNIEVNKDELEIIIEELIKLREELEAEGVNLTNQ